MITFAIVAHDEAESVASVVRQVRDALRGGDRLLVADSASTDGTAAVARAAGAEVLTAPLGKGAAMAAAARAARTPWIGFLDADLVAADRNIAAELRRATVSAPADTAMVVGDFTEPPPPPLLSNTVAVYAPLVRALAPEADGAFGQHPLSGFRCVRREIAAGGLPADFAVEAYLNLDVALAGRRHVVTGIGEYRQRFRYKPYMGREIARGVLDAAVAYGRLAADRRPEWEAWVEEVVAVVAGYRGESDGRAAYRERLERAAARPLPPAY